MNRREFTQITTSAAIATPFVLRTQRAEAFGPVCAAVAGFVVRQAVKQVFRTLTRGVSRRAVSSQLRSRAQQSVAAMSRTKDREPAFTRIATELGGEIAGEIASDFVTAALSQDRTQSLTTEAPSPEVPTEAAIAVAETPNGNAFCMAITTDVQESDDSTTYWTSSELIAVGHTSERMEELGIAPEVISQVLFPLETVETGWLDYGDGYVDYNEYGVGKPSVHRTAGGLLYLSNAPAGEDVKVNCSFVPKAGYQIQAFERDYSVTAR